MEIEKEIAGIKQQLISILNDHADLTVAMKKLKQELRELKQMGRKD